MDRPRSVAKASRAGRLGAASLALALLVAAPAAGQVDAETTAARAAPLLDRLETIEETEVAKPLALEVWEIWFVGPTEAATAGLAEARVRMRVFDLAGALEILGPLTEAHPDFAEAWNQKAFARFLRDEYDESLDDIERVLALEPRHFGALGGRAQILMRQGRMRLGQRLLREAVERFPWMPERAMLIPVKGEEI